jgi:hypothetical protein
MMRKESSGGQRSKFIKSEKMMKKDVSGGQRSKFKKSKKNDEKRRFRRWISKIPKKR